ncbi:predicted protein [Arabidopsis lyrata subsp. lyrata]|uniref:Predicted protein n=1 Tax=Arabidopsis lyrata subsp. lyrata TaxID=81972 RepID=D7LGS6_ARALL|nr:predicted protein [Arabidopsis lyrata subsp. lyrata]
MNMTFKLSNRILGFEASIDWSGIHGHGIEEAAVTAVTCISIKNSTRLVKSREYVVEEMSQWFLALCGTNHGLYRLREEKNSHALTLNFPKVNN